MLICFSPWLVVFAFPGSDSRSPVFSHASAGGDQSMLTGRRRNQAPDPQTCSSVEAGAGSFHAAHISARLLHSVPL